MEGEKRAPVTTRDIDRHYTELAFWYHLPLSTIRKELRRDVDKLAHWLPFHQDQFFLHMQEALHGVYEPRFEPSGEQSTDSSVTDLRDVRAVRAAANRHSAVIRGYREKKLTRGR